MRALTVGNTENLRCYILGGGEVEQNLTNSSLETPGHHHDERHIAGSGYLPRMLDGNRDKTSFDRSGETSR